MVKCWACGEEKSPEECNKIYGSSGLHYYCVDKDCHQRFIEDAGDPPDEPFEPDETS